MKFIILRRTVFSFDPAVNTAWHTDDVGFKRLLDTSVKIENLYEFFYASGSVDYLFFMSSPFYQIPRIFYGVHEDDSILYSFVRKYL